MNILMLTNIYKPLVGGITRSIDAFASEFRRRGHHVLIVAPEFGDDTPEEPGVVRMPAVPNMYRRQYPWPLPIPGLVHQTIGDFGPDVIHTHHPFLLGAAGQRESVLWDLPLVYTHHTKHHEYVQLGAARRRLLADLVWSVTLSYCELCDMLITPSRSIRSMLAEAGVERPMEVVPTGIDAARLGRGDGARARREYGIPDDAFVIGSVGRLEPEKNWCFLAPTLAQYLRQHGRVHCLVAGEGQLTGRIREAFARHGVETRLHLTGTLEGQPLIDAYHALDVFAFASHTETQGLVLIEAMAAGKPVVAVEASGVVDVVQDGKNGRLIEDEDDEAFRGALDAIQTMDSEDRRVMAQAARETAESLSLENCAERVLDVYQRAVDTREQMRQAASSDWPSPMRFLHYQWRAWSLLLENARQVMRRAEPSEAETPPSGKS